MTLRKDLCADALIARVRSEIKSIDDPRKKSAPTVSLADHLMSGYALFALKSASLLAFDNERTSPRFQHNMNNLFGIKNIPSDTSMREVLDEIEPNQLRPAFKSIFSAAQRGKCLERFVYLDGKYLVSLDGTGYFSSKAVHCGNCLEKTSKSTGETTYSHHMLAAVLVNPDEKVVIPLCPEPISKQDGSNKNDCERNAVARWLIGFRRDHPKLSVIITEDGLASNAPHIRDLHTQQCSFILGAKPGDHKFLFEQFHLATARIKEHVFTLNGVTHKFRFVNGLPLNEANQELLINFLYYQEEGKKGIKTFSWVTDIEITVDNIFKIMQGGRARWKIENETFNTLKNQGYNFEHNYGHGKQNLSVVFAFLMFLAFAVDQIQLAACKVFQQAKQKTRIFRSFWSRMRAWFALTIVPNWAALLRAIANDDGTIFPNTT